MFRMVKDILLIVGIGAVLASSLVAAIWGVTKFTPYVKVYNCDIAEISPDYPNKVKQDCRNLRSGRI